MKVTSLNSLLALISAAVILLASCKKTTTTAPDDSVSAQDATTISNALGSTTDDAACAAGQVSDYKSLISLNTAGGNLFVGATILDTLPSGIQISYDGVTYYNGVTRSGIVTVTRNNIGWDTAGSLLTLTYSNFQIKDSISGYSYTLNGTQTIANINGGLAWQVITGQYPGNSVVHQIQSSGLTVSFPNGAQGTWSVNKLISFYNPIDTSEIYVSEYGSPSAGNVTESGTDRYGNTFTNTVDSTIMTTSLCGWRPYTGKWTHTVSNRTATVRFGWSNTAHALVGTSTNPGQGWCVWYNNGGTTTIQKFFPYW